MVLLVMKLEVRLHQQVGNRSTALVTKPVTSLIVAYEVRSMFLTFFDTLFSTERELMLHTCTNYGESYLVLHSLSKTLVSALLSYETLKI